MTMMRVHRTINEKSLRRETMKRVFGPNTKRVHGTINIKSLCVTTDYKRKVHGTINIKSLCVTTDYNQRLGDLTACKSIVLAWCVSQATKESWWYPSK